LGVTPPLELLWGEADAPADELPPALAELYGGGLGFDRPCLYANFVATIDGTVALPRLPGSLRLIGDERPSDRFVMGLLRAFADAVLVGAGTMRAAPNATWGPERVYPAAADGFAELRERLGTTPHPRVAVMTASGLIDSDHPALAAGALVLTSEHGAAQLAGRVPDAAELVPLGAELTVDPVAAVAELRRRGYRLVLSEAGPTVFGALVGAGLVDELFLTISPFLAGGERSGSRLVLGEGIELLATQRTDARLRSVRRDGDFLFLRYALSEPAESRPS
jgi:riboflavin biosynthesis pyrimidine reductase